MVAIRYLPSLVKVIFLLAQVSCFGDRDPFASLRQGQLALPNGKIIHITLAITPKEQRKGLSGIPSETFHDGQGLFFFYLEDGLRQFWMPDTYFNLDIIFLDKNLKVLAIVRNLLHHPGRREPPPIARTKSYFCRYILEIRAGTELSQEIQIGMPLKWIHSLSLPEVKDKIRRRKRESQ